MTQTGLFGWIREGVRQSVLMGVSDAMEVMGTPNDPGQLHPALQSMAAQAPQRIAASGDIQATRSVGQASPQRKRLGRSLKDMSPLPASATTKSSAKPTTPKSES